MSNQSAANQLSIECHPIGEMITPFTQKFGIPRQSSGLTAIPGYIKLLPPYDDINGFRLRLLKIYKPIVVAFLNL